MKRMPLGLIFTALLYAILAILFLGGAMNLAPDLRMAEILAGLLLPLIGFGLLMRWGWARWFGAAGGVLLAWIGFMLTAGRGSVPDILLLFSGVLSTVLLLIPSTGDGRRDRPREGAGPTPAEIWTCAVSAAMLAGIAALLVFAAPTAGRAIRNESPAIQGLSSSTRVAWAGFGAGLDRAEVEGRPMLVDFFAAWCGPCQEMDRVTFRNSAVLNAMERIVPVRVDAEGTTSIRGYRGQELAQRYQVHSYPTLMLIDADGNVIVRKSGGLGPEEFIAWLDTALARYAADPENLEKQDHGRMM
jgi:thiol:disulfide interchange protein